MPLPDSWYDGSMTPEEFVPLLAGQLNKLPPGYEKPSQVWFCAAPEGRVSDGYFGTKWVKMDGDYYGSFINAMRMDGDYMDGHLNDASGRCIGVGAAAPFECLTTTINASGIAASDDPGKDALAAMALCPYEASHHIPAPPELKPAIREVVRKMMPMLVLHLTPDDEIDLVRGACTLHGVAEVKERMVKSMADRFALEVCWTKLKPNNFLMDGNVPFCINIGIAGWFGERDLNEDGEGQEVFLTEHQLHLPLDDKLIAIIQKMLPAIQKHVVDEIGWGGRLFETPDGKRLEKKLKVIFDEGVMAGPKSGRKLQGWTGAFESFMQEARRRIAPIVQLAAPPTGPQTPLDSAAGVNVQDCDTRFELPPRPGRPGRWPNGMSAREVFAPPREDGRPMRPPRHLRKSARAGSSNPPPVELQRDVTLEEFGRQYRAEVAAAEADDARRAQLNAKKREKKKRQKQRQREEAAAAKPRVSKTDESPDSDKSRSPSPTPLSVSIKHWQAVYTWVVDTHRVQWKQDRHDRMQTALNRVESRKQQIKRDQANKDAKEAKDRMAASVRARDNEILARAKHHGGLWAEEQPGLSKVSAAQGKKAERLEQRKEDIAKARAERMRIEAEQSRLAEEMAKNLEIGRAINRREKQELWTPNLN